MHSDNRIYGYRALNVRQIGKLAGEKPGRPTVYEFHYVNATRDVRDGIDDRNTVIAIFHGINLLPSIIAFVSRRERRA
jgi:hypothetical protein